MRARLHAFGHGMSLRLRVFGRKTRSCMCLSAWMLDKVPVGGYVRILTKRENRMRTVHSTEGRSYQKVWRTSQPDTSVTTKSTVPARIIDTLPENDSGTELHFQHAVSTIIYYFHDRTVEEHRHLTPTCIPPTQSHARRNGDACSGSRLSHRSLQIVTLLRADLPLRSLITWSRGRTNRDPLSKSRSLKEYLWQPWTETFSPWIQCRFSYVWWLFDNKTDSWMLCLMTLLFQSCIL